MGDARPDRLLSEIAERLFQRGRRIPPASRLYEWLRPKTARSWRLLQARKKVTRWTARWISVFSIFRSALEPCALLPLKLTIYRLTSSAFRLIAPSLRQITMNKELPIPFKLIEAGH